MNQDKSGGEKKQGTRQERMQERQKANRQIVRQKEEETRQ